MITRLGDILPKRHKYYVRHLHVCMSTYGGRGTSMYRYLVSIYHRPTLPLQGPSPNARLLQSCNG